MAERNWGAIRSGATFESLATTIVYFADPSARLFARQGKDGGQDARSSDGTKVFQAKYHENSSAAAAIRDAKKEAKKIEEYRKSGHGRHGQWSDVSHWCLVTNAEFNPTTRLAWETDIVPLFAEQGLVAELWERAVLEGMLDRFPEIHRSYFENETRVLLSMAEVKEQLPEREPFLRRETLGPFCGRSAEKARIAEFLTSDKLFLVVHGAGGTGKTRLLADTGDEIAGDGAWQVLWANVESMVATANWFESIVPERSTLLLVDEPPDERLLQQLAEQLGGRVGRTAKWKVVVAVRSPKDPVLRFLRLTRMRRRVEELHVFPLTTPDAEQMCFELLNTGKLAQSSNKLKRDAARQLSQAFARHPIWLTLAIQHLEDHGDLKQVPADAGALADEYLFEIERQQSETTPESVRHLLRWIALIGTVNRQDDTTIKLIGDSIGVPSLVELRERIALLVQRRVLAERGAHRRFVELKPDVLRDHVLLRWLATDVGKERHVSDDGIELIKFVRDAAVRGSLNELGRAILISLARTEFILRLAGHEFGLMGEFFGSLERSVPALSASQRMALAELLEVVAHFQPGATASLVATLRIDSVGDEVTEGVFGTRVVSQANVLLALAWPLFGAAMGAESPDEKEAVLRELCALTEAEAVLAPALSRGLPNDGRRAASLVARVLEGGPQFWSDFDDTAKEIARELIDAMTTAEPSDGQSAVVHALLHPLLETERRQSWADDRTFSWRTVPISPGGSAWLAREAVLADIKAALRRDAIPTQSRVQFWHLFARVRGDEKLEQLKWTHDVLSTRSVSFDELTAAREVWDWYRQYSKDPAIKSAANELEEVYRAHELAKEFQVLLPNMDIEPEHHEDHCIAKAAELAAETGSQAILGFVDRAVTFLGGEQSLYRISSVAWSLGKHAEATEAVRAFVFESLKRASIDGRTEFVVVAAISWVREVRKTEPGRTHALIMDLLDQCGSDERRAHLLERIYARVPKLRDVGDFTAEEHSLLRASNCLFERTGRDVAFVAALALSLGHDWPSLRPLLEKVLASMQPARLPEALRALVDAVYWALCGNEPAQPPPGLREWLLSQLLALPDIDNLGGNGEWHLNELLKRLGRPGVEWLPAALRRRRECEASNGGGLKWRAAAHRERVSKYVRPIEPAQASDAPIRAAVDELLDLVDDVGTVGYYLPEILRDVDPFGVVVPTAVAERTQAAASADDIRRLARIGGAYPTNSQPWRIIALAAVRTASALGKEAVRSAYGSLGDRGIRSWSSAVGEVPSIFVEAVSEARAALEAEAEPELRPFWEDWLASANADLLERQERAKEDRGE